MDSHLTETFIPNAQSARPSSLSSVTESARSMFVSVPPRKPFMRYRDRLELARAAAKLGLGFEDLQVTFKLVERDARKLVGLKP
jgi:hypothetical protein